MTIAWEWLFEPAALFDSLVYGADAELWEEQSGRYDVIGLPGGVPAGAIVPGDLVVTRALGEGRVGDVVPVDPDHPVVGPGGRLPHDRLVLRPRRAVAEPPPCGCAGGAAAEAEAEVAEAEAAGCGCVHGAESDAEAGPAVCAPAAEPDPTGKGPHPTVRRPNKRPAVGYAQQCLGNWMTRHAGTAHACGDPAYVEQAFRRLRAAAQFPLVVDCDFGSNTDTATRAFQACSKIGRDGAIGPITWPLLKAHDPARGGATPPARRASEVDVDHSFELFAEYFHAIPGDPSRNLFRASDRAAALAAGNDSIARLTEYFTELAAGEVIATAPNGDFLVSLRGNLVLPSTVPETGAPLALLLHGNHPVFRPDPPLRANEVRSDQGYAYLQRDLAARGIASLSVNANVTYNGSPTFEADPQLRGQVLALHFALLVALVTGRTPSGSPLRIRLPGSGMVSLGTALADTGPASGPLAKVRDLAGALREARIDFGRVAVFGHSRAGWSAQHFAEVAAAAAAAGVPPTTKVDEPRPAEDAVAAVTTGIVRALGRPAPADVKAVVSFQAEEDDGTPLRLPDLFLLVVNGTHDEDVGQSSVTIYEAPTCAKAAVVVHGGTHSRFNTVWAKAPVSKSQVNGTIACQPNPVRVLSEAAHQAVAKAFVGDFLEARLRGAASKLLLLTGEKRAPMPVDVVRTWRFAHPVGRAGGLVDLDGRVRFANPAGSAPATRAKEDAIHQSTRDPAHRQGVASWRIVRAGTTTAELHAPVTPADGLPDRTHFSFRMSKEMNVKSAAARTSEPLRNFEIQLRDAAGAVVGRAIPGAAVASILQRPYPTKIHREADDKVACTEDTEVYLQTVEVPLAQFLRGTTATAADLARVARVVVRLVPAPGRTGDDVFRITDLTLSTRTGL